MTPNTSKVLRPSNIYFVFALVIVSAAVAYGVLQFQILQSEKQAVLDNEARQAQVTGVLADEKAGFKTFADERAKKQEELGDKISGILPPDENYTELTRSLDNYFAEHDRAGNSIQQDNLRFGKGSPLPQMSNVSALPVFMNLRSTRDNFFKFLDFVNNSGSLETGTRLMDINSIDITFSKGGEVIEDMKQEIVFNVSMNAYYQTPKVARP